MMQGLGINGHWIGIHDSDSRAIALYRRHYSSKKNPHSNNAHGICGPSSRMLLLTVDCLALFAWVKRIRDDGQEGINCSIFRNEGPILSSDLILEAEELAWQRWPGERLFTYVWDAKLRQPSQKYRKPKEAGRCFIKAGWKDCGRNKDGRLTILEKLP